MKRITFLLLVLICIPNMVLAEEAPRNIAVYIKGEELQQQLEEGVVTKENRTFLPVRSIADKLNYKVHWNENEREVSITGDKQAIKMNIGSKAYLLNNESKTMDVSPFISNNRTYVPVRFVAEGLNRKISWDGENRMVLIDEFQTNQEASSTNTEIVRIKELKRHQNGKTEKIAVDLSFKRPAELKDQIIFKETEFGYTFYDKLNHDASKGELGRIGSLEIYKDPVQIPAPMIILDKLDSGYLCFTYSSDAQVLLENEELEKFFINSRTQTRKLLHTIEIENK